MRIIHLFVICALVFAAAYVYRIKMESTTSTERVLRLRADIRKEREHIAVLRAEWATLISPKRLQELAGRHLDLKPVEAVQFDRLRNLPPRPPSFIQPNAQDPIAAMIDTVERDETTGSVFAPEGVR